MSTKDASSIPFPMTFMATIVTFLWLLYGIILDNSFMVVSIFMKKCNRIILIIGLINFSGTECPWFLNMLFTVSIDLPV